MKPVTELVVYCDLGAHGRDLPVARLRWTELEADGFDDHGGVQVQRHRAVNEWRLMETSGGRRRFPFIGVTSGATDPVSRSRAEVSHMEGGTAIVRCVCGDKVRFSIAKQQQNLSRLAADGRDRISMEALRGVVY